MRVNFLRLVGDRAGVWSMVYRLSEACPLPRVWQSWVLRISIQSWRRPVLLQLEKVRLPNVPWGIGIIFYFIYFSQHSCKGSEVSPFSTLGLLEVRVIPTQGHVLLWMPKLRVHCTYVTVVRKTLPCLCFRSLLPHSWSQSSASGQGPTHREWVDAFSYLFPDWKPCIWILNTPSLIFTGRDVWKYVWVSVLHSQNNNNSNLSLSHCSLV